MSSRDINAADQLLDKPVVWGCPWHGELMAYAIEITPPVSESTWVVSMPRSDGGADSVAFITRHNRTTGARQCFIPMGYPRIILPTGLTITQVGNRYFTPDGVEVYYWAAKNRYYRHYAEQMKVYSSPYYTMFDAAENRDVHIGLAQDSPAGQRYTDLVLGDNGALYIPHVDVQPLSFMSNPPLNGSVNMSQFFTFGSTSDNKCALVPPVACNTSKYTNPVKVAEAQGRVTALGTLLSRNGMSMPPYSLALRGVVDGRYLRSVGSLQITRDFILATNPNNGEVWKINLPSFSTATGLTFNGFSCFNLHRFDNNGNPINVELNVSHDMGYIAGARPVIRYTNGSTTTVNPSSTLKLFDVKEDGSQFIFGLTAGVDMVQTGFGQLLYSELDYSTRMLDPISDTYSGVTFSGLGYYAYSFVLASVTFNPANPDSITISLTTLYNMSQTFQASVTNTITPGASLGGTWGLASSVTQQVDVHAGIPSGTWTITWNVTTFSSTVTGNPPSGTSTTINNEDFTRIATVAFNSAGAPTPLTLTYSGHSTVTSGYEQKTNGTTAELWAMVSEAPNPPGIPHNMDPNPVRADNGGVAVMFEQVTRTTETSSLVITWGSASKSYSSSFSQVVSSLVSSFARGPNASIPTTTPASGTATDYQGATLDASQRNLSMLYTRIGQNPTGADKMVVTDFMLIPKIVFDTAQGVPDRETQYLSVVNCGYRAVMVTMQCSLNRLFAHNLSDNLVKYEAILTPDGLVSTGGFDGSIPNIFYQHNQVTGGFNSAPSFLPQTFI